MIIYPLVFADLTMESGTVVFNCFQHFCVYIMYIYIHAISKKLEAIGI